MNYTPSTLLATQTGIEFDNRLLMGVLPVQTHAGVAFQGLAMLDFDLISTLQEKLPPAWEGVWEGLDILQLFEGDFGGNQRAFAVVHSRVDASIQLWELLTQTGNTPPSNRFDNNDTRIEWRGETPAFTWNREFDLKQLDGAEIWLDELAGTVDITVQYREDASPCWQNWVQVSVCSARNQQELTGTVTPAGQTPYPVNITYCEGQKFALTLPAPQPGECDVSNLRPTNRGYQFQLRLTITGFCRVRGVLVRDTGGAAAVRERELHMKKFIENSAAEGLIAEIRFQIRRADASHDMTAAEIVGILEMLKVEVLEKARNEPHTHLN